MDEQQHMAMRQQPFAQKNRHGPETLIGTFSLLKARRPHSSLGCNLFFFPPLSIRIKPAQKSPGIANGTAAMMGQQQAKALCDISAQVQQYQQFLGE